MIYFTLLISPRNFQFDLIIRLKHNNNANLFSFFRVSPCACQVKLITLYYKILYRGRLLDYEFAPFIRLDIEFKTTCLEYKSTYYSCQPVKFSSTNLVPQTLRSLTHENVVDVVDGNKDAYLFFVGRGSRMLFRL